jgi:molecular chaperone DnaK (HSP70)
MKYILGIDYGTANTVAAYIAEGEKETFIASPAEANTTQGMVFPSYVEFDQNGNPINVGKKAWESSQGGSNTVVWGSKRLIGLPFEEAKTELRYLHYAITKAPNGGVHIIAGSKPVTPEDIASLVLEKVKRDVENPKINTLSGKIVKVVVTHPANFDHERIKLIKEATQKAFKGVDVKTVTEPEATAMAYGIKFKPDKPEKIAVIDIGAGTLDVVIAMVGMDKQGQVFMSPGASRGKANLGGLDIDELIMDWVIEKTGFTELNDVRGMDRVRANTTNLQILKDLQKLRRQVEDEKILLSRYHESSKFTVSCQGKTVELTLSEQQMNNDILGIPLTKKRLEEVLGKLPTVEELKEMKDVLRNISPDKNLPEGVLPSFLDIFQIVTMNSITLAGTTPEKIQHTILVGGPMYMRGVRSRVMEIFRNNEAISKELTKIDKVGFSSALNPMQCVARGAALCGGKTTTPLPADYVIPFLKADEREKRPRPVYVCDKNEGKFLCIGDVQGKEKSVTRTLRSGGGAETEVELALLAGVEETGISGDPERRLWRRKGCYKFFPTYNSRGQAEYTMTLRYDDNGISCTCYDHESKKSFDYYSLNQLDGGEVDLKWIMRGDRSELSRGLIEYLDALAQNILNIKIPVWIKQQHPAEKEKNRSEILYLKEILAQAYENAPRPQTMKWERNESGETVTREPAEIETWGNVLDISVEIDSLIWDDVVTNLDVDTVRNRAQYLFIKANEVKTNKNIPEEKKRRVIESRDFLEKTMSGLPASFNSGFSSRLQDLATYKEVKTRCETLRNAIEAALGEKLPD